MSWHHGMIGDVEKLWQDYTGKGVHVGVYDSGVQYEHWDLAPNYDASRHVVVDGKEYDGDFHPASGPHGTAVAGIIGAARNGRGTVGIANEASLTGVNIFNPYSEDGAGPGIFVNAPDRTKFLAAMEQAATFDVVNHSWGGRGAFASFFSRDVEGTRARDMAKVVEHAADNGRNGLGTISVKASGNTIIPGQGSLDDQSDGWASSRHVVVVGAYRGSDGSSAFYSTHGAHLLVSAPSAEIRSFDTWKGMTTTDLLGRAGYNLRAAPGAAIDYTDSFGGTSAAAPVVSGVVTLMLDANEGLGWRDVSNILAASSKMPVAFETGQTSMVALSDRPLDEIEKGKVYLLNSSSFKLGGSDAGWNGGRMHYSTDYGYGAVDAYAAVRMAEVWSLFGSAKSSSNEAVVDTGTVAISVTPPNNGAVTPESAFNDFIGTPASTTIAVTGNVATEHVDLTIGFDARSFGDPVALSNVRFKVIAPDNTSAFVDTFSSQFATVEGKQEFTFGLTAFRGVAAEGTWRVEFEAFDTRFETTTVITDLRMRIYGSTLTTDDVYSYTDEFSTMTAIAGEGGRRVLSDVDGGSDWINAAAVTSDVALSLVEGATTRFDGQDAFAVAAGSRIEHAVTGDGNDRLVGNALDNKLYGMRGNDWLNGGAGNDTLFGGQGSDVFAFDTAGVSGKDRVLDWSVGDRIASSKMLRGADQSGLVTLDTSALVLLDGSMRGDTAQLVGKGGAVLQAMGKQDGYWWYGFVSGENTDHVDGRVTELAVSQTGRPANDPAVTVSAVSAAWDDGFTQATAFFLYDTMGDAMASGVQTFA
jgi:subtilisin family serine protease